MLYLIVSHQTVLYESYQIWLIPHPNDSNSIRLVNSEKTTHSKSPFKTPHTHHLKPSQIWTL